MSDMSSLGREDQRLIGALKLSTDYARDHGVSTLLNTIHCTADQIDWLVIDGGDVFRDYTAKERRRMATEGRAMADGSYPVIDSLGAAIAIRAIGRAKAEKHTQVVAHICKRVRALGCNGPIFEKYQ